MNYIVPHRIIINNVMFLAFNYSSESNEALTLRVENFTKNIKNKDKEIEKFKEENHSLKNTLKFWKNKFLRVMLLIKDKLFGKKKTRKIL